MWKHRSLLFSVLLLVFVWGCGDDDSPSAPVDIPIVSAVEIGPNSHNALSSVVAFQYSNATSAKVVYWESGGLEQETPVYPLAGEGMGRIVTLGLEPGTEYQHRVEVLGSNGEAVSDSAGFTSGELPEYLEERVILFVYPNSEPLTGYAMTNLRETPDGLYSIIFDFTGRIVWYRKWDILGGFFEQQQNGNFVAFLGTTTGFHPSFGYYAEVQPDGEMVGRYQAQAPLYTDNHDILLDFDGGGVTSHLISYDLRSLDLTDLGGPADARVAGHQILRYGPGGMTEFVWNIWDHFGLEYWMLGRQPEDCTNCDYDHPNSLAVDHDGHYLLSIRNFSEVTKINSMTGDIIWRLGGLGNQFTFVNDPSGGFSGQHFARTLDNGNLLLYDNGTAHQPQVTRVVEYAIDTANMTATLVWEHRRAPAIYTGALGSVQRLKNGNTFIGYGNLGIASEVDPAGLAVWDIEMEVDGIRVTRAYRVIKIKSLYEYERP